MELIQDFELSLNIDDILRGEGMDPAIARTKKPALLTAASNAFHQGTALLHPAAFLHQSRVVQHRHDRILLDNGRELAGPLVARHLSGAEQVVVAVNTIGAELESFASSSMATDPLLALALDGLGNAAVDILGQQVCSLIGERAQTSGLTVSSPLSPGEPEWPVDTGQPQIFSILDPSMVGIRLTSGGMMIPKKSTSFVVGIGAEMDQTDLCELCNLRERCRYRHA